MVLSLRLCASWLGLRELLRLDVAVEMQRREDGNGGSGRGGAGGQH